MTGDLVRIEQLAGAIRADADLATAEMDGYYTIDAPTYVGRIEANAKTIADLADHARRELERCRRLIDRAIVITAGGRL